MKDQTAKIKNTDERLEIARVDAPFEFCSAFLLFHFSPLIFSLSRWQRHPKKCPGARLRPGHGNPKIRALLLDLETLHDLVEGRHVVC